MTGLQPKLKIGSPGDKYEREADATADRVMRMSEGESLRMQPMEEEEEELQAKLRMQPEEEEEEIQMACDGCREESILQRQTNEEEEEMLQPKLQGDRGDTVADTGTAAEISRAKSSGTSLDGNTLSFMSNRFGTDFSRVKIHNDSRAHRLNNQLNARAFTVGNHIFFNKGNYSPGNSSGKRLLAHELTHVLQQDGGIRPMIQKNGNTRSRGTSGGSRHPLADLVAGLLREQFSNSSMRKHLSSLGTALQGLAVESTATGGDQPAATAERLSALGVARAFEITSRAILNDRGFANLRRRIVDIVGSSEETTLITLLAAALAAVLADVPLRGSPSHNLGAGFSAGGSFDLGSIRSLQFNNLQLYAQYARAHFRTRLTGTVNRNADTGEFSGTGTGEIRLGDKTSHLLGRVTINQDGEVTLFGRLSSGYNLGGNNQLIFTTDLTHTFATGESIIRPGMSGRFSLGHDQSLRLGTRFTISSESGFSGVTGFLEYRNNLLRLRIEGSTTSLPEATGISPGGDMRIQGVLTIPLW